MRHVDEAASQKGHAVGGLVVVQVLEAPPTHVGLFIHEAWGVSDHLQEALLLGLAQILEQEVVSSGEAHQGVGHWNLVPGGVFHQPGNEEVEKKKADGGEEIKNIVASQWNGFLMKYCD